MAEDGLNVLARFREQISARSLWFNTVVLSVAAILFFVYRFLLSFLVVGAGPIPPVVEGLIYLPREIGMACVIAAIVNLFVERLNVMRHEEIEGVYQGRLDSQREESDRQARQDLLKAVFQRNLPKSVIDQIEQRLFEPTLYRTTSAAIYYLSLANNPARGRYVKLEAYHSHRIVNTSQRSAIQVITAQVDLPTSFADDIKIVSLKIDGEMVSNLQNYLSKDEVNKKLVLRYPLTIPAQSGVDAQIVTLGAGAECSFEVLCSVMPCDVMTVRCHAPPELVISASSLHPNEAIIEFQSAHETTWRLDGVLPGQGLLVRWDPREIEK
jgi:hypothetical protein